MKLMIIILTTFIAFGQIDSKMISISNNDDFIFKDSTPNINKIKLPFGCIKIKSLPKSFDTYKIDKDGSYTNEFTYYDREYLSIIVDCYNPLNFGVMDFEIPEYKNIEIINVGNYKNWNFNRKYFRFTNKCKYQLPDFGPYKVFYSTIQIVGHDIGIIRQDKSYNYIFSEIGNLFFCNDSASIVKVINIYIGICDKGENEWLQRLYFINEDKSIELFDYYSCCEEETTLINKYTIKITPSGEINVE